MNRRKFLFFSAGTVAVSAYASQVAMPPCACDSNPGTWYLPKYLNSSPNNLQIKVRDTDSAFGRYNKEGNVKIITIEDVVKYHGHLCDGVVFAFLQLSVGLAKLFPEGIVDRSNIVGVCKNSPCLVDTMTYLTGAKINFKTLRIDSSVGPAHIIQKISTKETYKVSLANGMFSKELKKAEHIIKSKLKKGEQVLPREIDKAEKLADEFIYKMLHIPLEKLVKVEKLNNYKFTPNKDASAFGSRGDVKNKYVNRT